MGKNPLKQGKGLSLIIQHTSVNALTTGCWLKVRSQLHFADQEFYHPSPKAQCLAHKWFKTNKIKIEENIILFLSLFRSQQTLFNTSLHRLHVWHWLFHVICLIQCPLLLKSKGKEALSQSDLCKHLQIQDMLMWVVSTTGTIQVLKISHTTCKRDKE